MNIKVKDRSISYEIDHNAWSMGDFLLVCQHADAHLEHEQYFNQYVPIVICNDCLGKDLTDEQVDKMLTAYYLGKGEL